MDRRTPLPDGDGPSRPQQQQQQQQQQQPHADGVGATVHPTLSPGTHSYDGSAIAASTSPSFPATPSGLLNGSLPSSRKSSVSDKYHDETNDIMDPDERAEQILEAQSDGEDILPLPGAILSPRQHQTMPSLVVPDPKNDDDVRAPASAAAAASPTPLPTTAEGQHTQGQGQGHHEEKVEAARELDTRRQNQLRKQAKFTKASVIIPPENFAVVEDGLYRSAQPTELNFPFLQRLNLHSLIWLAPEDPTPTFQEFIQEHSIQLHHLGVHYTSNAWDPLTEDAVMKALEIVLQPSSYPLMIMCNLGRHRTGTVVGCLRKLQRWNLASIFEEYRRHAGAKVRVMNEQFIELFDTDLIQIPNPNAERQDAGAGPPLPLSSRSKS